MTQCNTSVIIAQSLTTKEKNMKAQKQTADALSAKIDNFLKSQDFAALGLASGIIEVLLQDANEFTIEYLDSFIDKYKAISEEVE